MRTAEQEMEERLRELARRVAVASMMSYQTAREAIQSVLERYNIVLKINDSIKTQLDEIHKHIYKRTRGRNSGWYANSPARRELVTRHGPRVLLVLDKPDSRRYRNIRTKKQKRRRRCPGE